MTLKQDAVENANAEIFLAVSRGRALGRGVLLGAPAVMLGTISVAIYVGLSSGPAAAQRGLVDVSLRILALPLPVVALFCGARSLRWLLLAAWPARIGVQTAIDALTLRLGPFGVRRYRADELRIEYPFESSDDDEERSFEAFLPEEEQLARFVPRMLHPRSREPLDRVILKFVAGEEEQIAVTLGPAITRWRAAKKGHPT